MNNIQAAAFIWNVRTSFFSFIDYLFSIDRKDTKRLKSSTCPSNCNLLDMNVVEDHCVVHRKCCRIRRGGDLCQCWSIVANPPPTTF